MLDLRRLSMLREVALHGSIAEASRALGVSPSAVSQQLSRLEQETGTALLVPQGRGVRLTGAARTLVARTEEILAHLEAAETELDASRTGPHGTLQIAAFASVSRAVMPVVLQRLRLRAPGVRTELVQLDPHAAIEELSARRADLVIADDYPGNPIPRRSGLLRHELGSDPLTACLPCGVAADADPAAQGWVLEPRGTEAHRWALGVCREAGFEPEVRFQSPDLGLHRDLVEAGLAAGFLPGLVGGPPEGAATITLGPPAARSLYALTRRGTERRESLRLCLAVLAEVIDERLSA